MFNLFGKIFSRKDLVGGSASGWDRDKVEVVKDDCQIFAPYWAAEELDDCQIFFEGVEDEDQTLFYE